MEKKKIILKPGYAVSFITRFFIILIAAFGLSGFALTAFLNRNIGPTYLKGLSRLSALQAQLPYILFITAFIQAIALCILALLLSLLWSHSIAGPLKRFRRHLKEAAEGKLSKEPLNFRETDQLQGMAKAFSEMSLAYKEKQTKALALLNEAQRFINAGRDLEKLNEIYLQIKEIYSEKKSA